MGVAILNMTDLNTGKDHSREIDISNAMSNGAECWELRGEGEQRKNLERWIKERGNEQHSTGSNKANLLLNNFTIIK